MDSKNTKFLDPEKVVFQLNLAKGSTIVDLGAGSGFFALASSKATGPTGKVFVIDILDSALDHVQSSARIQNINNIHTIRKDLEKDSIPEIVPGTVDLVIMANVMHQTKNHSNLFAETYRMLKTGAHLLVVDWNEIVGPLGPKADERIGEVDVKKIAQKSNLKFEKQIDADKYHYGLIFIK